MMIGEFGLLPFNAGNDNRTVPFHTQTHLLLAPTNLCRLLRCSDMGIVNLAV